MPGWIWLPAWQAPVPERETPFGFGVVRYAVWHAVDCTTTHGMGAVWTIFVCHMSLVVTAAYQTQADRQVGADGGSLQQHNRLVRTRVHCLAAATAAGKGGWAGAPGGVATSCHVVTQCLLICLRSPSLYGLCLPQFFLKSSLRLPSWGSILASACCCIACTSSCDVCSCV